MSGDKLAIFRTLSDSLLPQQVPGWQVSVTILLRQNKHPIRWDNKSKETSSFASRKKTVFCWGNVSFWNTRRLQLTQGVKSSFQWSLSSSTSDWREKPVALLNERGPLFRATDQAKPPSLRHCRQRPSTSVNRRPNVLVKQTHWLNSIYDCQWGHKTNIKNASKVKYFG